VLSLGDDVGAPQVTQAEMDALVDEAHRLGRKTAAHAHGAEGAKVAIRAGIDSIEHGSFLDDEAVRLMKEKGTDLVPTLMAGEYAGGRKARRTYPPEIAEKATQALEGRSRAFKLAVAAGVKIAFGTDSVPWCQRGLRSQSDPSHHHESTGPAAACALQGPAFLVRAAAKLEWQGLPVSPVAD
jgi:imidazolonepropionase-like amidohydrolase